MRTINLAFESFGVTGSPLIILHGLFGSRRNWNRVARQLATRYNVYLPDLRNHGQSEHDAAMDYPHMAADLSAFLEQRQIKSASFIGHSMGGKVAMWMALTKPLQVEKLIVVDVAPVTYGHEFGTIFDGLRGLPLAALSTRKEADLWLSDCIPDIGLRQFLLQNLVSTESGYAWRIDLEIFANAIPALLSFPPTESVASYVNPALFLGGANSRYLVPKYFREIEQLFRNSRIEIIADAGHWLHMDQPDQFLTLIHPFLAE